MYFSVLISKSKVIINFIPSTIMERINFRSPFSLKSFLLVAGSIVINLKLSKEFWYIFFVSVFVLNIIFSFILFSICVVPKNNEDFNISISLFLDDV